MKSGSQRTEWGLAVPMWTWTWETCCPPSVSSLWKDGTGRSAHLPWWGQHLSSEKCFRPAVFSQINASKFSWWETLEGASKQPLAIAQDIPDSVKMQLPQSIWPIAFLDFPNITTVAFKDKRTSCSWVSISSLNFLDQLLRICKSNFKRRYVSQTYQDWLNHPNIIWLHLRTFSTVHCTKVKADLTEVVMMNRGLKSFEKFWWKNMGNHQELTMNRT